MRIPGSGVVTFPSVNAKGEANAVEGDGDDGNRPSGTLLPRPLPAMTMMIITTTIAAIPIPYFNTGLMANRVTYKCISSSSPNLFAHSHPNKTMLQCPLCGKSMTLADVMGELDDLYANHPPSAHRYSWLRHHLSLPEHAMDTHIRRILQLEIALSSASVAGSPFASGSSSDSSFASPSAPSAIGCSHCTGIVVIPFHAVGGEKHPAAAEQGPGAVEGAIGSGVLVDHSTHEVVKGIVPDQSKAGGEEGVGQAGAVTSKHAAPGGVGTGDEL
jgi:hypothetical protein